MLDGVFLRGGLTSNRVVLLEHPLFKFLLLWHFVPPTFGPFDFKPEDDGIKLVVKVVRKPVAIAFLDVCVEQVVFIQLLCMFFA